MRVSLLLTLFLGFSLISSAQQSSHVPGQLLVSLSEGTSGQSLERSLSELNGEPTELKALKQVSKYMNIWLLEFNENAISESNMMRVVGDHPKVEVVQVNHIVNHRAVPNDALFDEQWQYINDGSNGGVVDADIDADEAWDITTGGTTVQGDDIVAAVLDDGHDLDHPDFEDNLWVNSLEIPGNGIDDDNNGYIDDYEGWSIVTNSDNIAGGGHGTPVAGIIGAKGNNGIGVTGVNWDVKVMVIKNNFNTNEASVIEAYSYALTMRQMYNESNGEDGAFVVATNASWGVDFGNPDNAPLWCGFYDIMGEHGILSCGATINGNQNVDVIGDLPTACPSDFMISVTNCNNTDNKVTNAGYGVETIDLGAHGAGAFTTSQGSGYGGFGGTSGATPHVTGAIALLYSAPCPSFIALAKADPEAAALLARQYILDGVDPNESLEGITTTGGRLNLKNSLDLLMADCATGGCFPPYNLSAEQAELNYVLNWESFDEDVTYNLQYREVGNPDWIEMNNIINNSYLLTDLDLCATYEFRVQSVCSEEVSDFTDSFSWTTDGCCEAPETIFAEEALEESILVGWNFVLAAESYDLRYRQLGSAPWLLIDNITDTEAFVTDLLPCTTYEFEVRTSCAGGETTSFSPPFELNTSGCGACTALTYCGANGSNSSEEWIGEVSLHTINNISGSDDGYGDYTSLSTTLNPGAVYGISVTPEFAGDLYDEYINAWIDFNQNGIFEANEMVLDSDGPTQSAISADFTVPVDVMQGGTRLRVIMRYNTTAGPCQQNFNFGEVEDYCVLFSDTTTSVEEEGESQQLSVFPNPAKDILNLVISGNQISENFRIVIFNALGQPVHSAQTNQQNTQIDISQWPSGVYQIMLQHGDETITRKPVILSK